MAAMIRVRPLYCDTAIYQSVYYINSLHIVDVCLYLKILDGNNTESVTRITFANNSTIYVHQLPEDIVSQIEGKR